MFRLRIHHLTLWLGLLSLVLAGWACGGRPGSGDDDRGSKEKVASSDSSGAASDGSGSDSDRDSDTSDTGTDRSGSDSDRSGGKSRRSGGDSDRSSKDDEKEDEEEAVPVEVAPLTRGRIESTVRSSANLEAENEVQVFAQARGLVRALKAEEGDLVKAGQLLVRLEDDEERSNLARARAAFEKAEREFNRQQRLREQDLASEQAYNDAVTAHDQLKIDVDDAQRLLSYTEVKAPISGTITARMINVGDRVQINQHIFDIIDFESLVARVYVPEKNLAQLRPGLSARISTHTSAGKEFVGEVSRIAPTVDPRSGTVKVTVAIGGQEGLLPGMFVDVDLVTAVHPDAILIPKRALVYDSDQMFVYRLGAERRVERKRVVPVLTDRDHVEPLEGLAEGDSIVVAGQAGLRDGALVSLPGNEAAEAKGTGRNTGKDDGENTGKDTGQDTRKDSGEGEGRSDAG